MSTETVLEHWGAMMAGPDWFDADAESLATRMAAYTMSQEDEEFKANDPLAERARSVVRHQQRWEANFERYLERFWERHKRVMLERIRAVNFRKGTALWDPPGTVPLTDRIDMLVELDRWDGEFADDLTPMLRDLYADSVENLSYVETKADDPDRDARRDSFVARWLAHAREHNLAIREAVQQVLSDDYTVTDDLISAVDRQASRVAGRARSRTAISMAVGGSNQAQYEQALSDQVATHKVWYSAQDTRVRPSHRLADGQKRPLDEPFDVAAAEMQYPGDITASPQLWINCRCILLLELAPAFQPEVTEPPPPAEEKPPPKEKAPPPKEPAAANILFVLDQSSSTPIRGAVRAIGPTGELFAMLPFSMVGREDHSYLFISAVVRTALAAQQDQDAQVLEQAMLDRLQEAHPELPIYGGDPESPTPVRLPLRVKN